MSNLQPDFRVCGPIRHFFPPIAFVPRTFALSRWCLSNNNSDNSCLTFALEDLVKSFLFSRSLRIDRYVRLSYFTRGPIWKERTVALEVL